MKKVTAYQITAIAFAAVMNLVGGQIALMLRLPIYLDSLGTMFVAILLGPWYGMLPGLLSGVISGISTDVYALYFMPVQLITGMMTGLLFAKPSIRKRQIPLRALAITVPGTLVSSCICAFLFGGVTSSGSSFFVMLLRKIGLSDIASVFVIQVVTDYLDRILAVVCVLALIACLPKDMIEQIQRPWLRRKVEQQ